MGFQLDMEFNFVWPYHMGHVIYILNIAELQTMSYVL